MRSLHETATVGENSGIRKWMTGLLGAVVFLLAAALLGPGGRDDAYKTLWPAEALATQGQLINYNGESLEQSSSLLHVLLLSGLRAVFGGPIEVVNLAFTAFCGVLGIFLAMGLSRRMGLAAKWPLALALGTQGMWVYWAMGGLDTVLAADCWLLFLWALMACLEDGRWRMLPLAIIFLVLARPENGLIAFDALTTILAIHILRRPKSAEQSTNKRLLRAAGLVFFAFAGLVAWRIWFGGHWLPQSALAKSDGISWVKAKAGIGYLVLETYRHWELIPLWLGLGVGAMQLLSKSSLPQKGQLLMAVIVVGMAFVVLSGGDWMENGRFLVPFIPLLILQLFLVIARLQEKWQLPLQLTYVMASILGLLWIAAHFNTGYSFLFGRPMRANSTAYNLSSVEQYNKIHLRDAFPYAMLLEEHDRIFQAKGEKVIILSQQAGFMMFHLARERYGTFRFVDLVGLCTADFTDCPVTQGRGRMRGGLNMDLVYLFGDLERLQAECDFEKPDIVFGLDDESLSLCQSLELHGYEIVALQKGSMLQGKDWFKGMEIEAIEFVAIERKWSRNLPIKENVIQP